jgi:protoheme ferro-lyase
MTTQEDAFVAVVLLSFGGPEGPEDVVPFLENVTRGRNIPRARLEPDVYDHLRALRAAGVEGVVVVPIGFVADHMEVKYDLDTQARAVAEDIGLRMERALAVGVAPAFVAGLRELIACHLEGRTPPTLGTRGPRPYPCRPGCCAYAPSREPRV